MCIKRRDTMNIVTEQKSCFIRHRHPYSFDPMTCFTFAIGPLLSSSFFFPPLTPVTGSSDSKKSGYLQALCAEPTEPMRHAPPSTRIR